MANTRYLHRQVATGRQARQIKEDNQRLREFVANLPFNKIILLQEMWERQLQEIRPQRPFNPEHRR